MTCSSLSTNMLLIRQNRRTITAMHTRKSPVLLFLTRKPGILKKSGWLLLLGMSFFSLQAQRTFSIKGQVMEDDSLTPVPFTYVINTHTGNGCMSDFNGNFMVQGTNQDTLIFSYLGYIKKKLLISLIKNSNDSCKESIKVIMRKSVIDLNTFDVIAFKIKPYERDYMNRIINRPKTTGVNALSSPITALYDQFSKKGRENRKLAEIFEQLFIQEQVAQKLNPQILTELTGDADIDFERFRKFCYSLSDQYILNHEGYELYEAVMQCYRRWKREKK